MMHEQHIEVSIEVDEAFAAEIDGAQLSDLVRHVLNAEGVAEPCTVNILITTEEELHELNRTYRGVDRSTDVLSFGDDEPGGFVRAPGQPLHLGDLAISYPHVVRQAEEYGHSRKRELSYLATHGLLHLLGYDHEQPDDRRRMRQREEELLGSMDIRREEMDGE